ncbi:unnamed protein product [Kluyveromyces dobzhanskii CBS 2104]|nr:unnamed protein product [Kluyveromyces dobzhanskii CBS 2104]
MSTLLSFLIRDEVIDEGTAFALIYSLLKDKTDDKIILICHILSLTGRQLQTFDKESEADIAEKLRLVYQDNYTDKNVYLALDRLFNSRRLYYEDQRKNIEIPTVENTFHEVVIDFSKDQPCVDLDTFRVQDNPELIDEQYDEIKQNILEELFKTEDKANAIKDMTDTENMAFKKKSTSSSRARFLYYGILAERLTSFHTSWEDSFSTVFKENYETITDYDPSNIRNLGKFWGHALATQCISFEVFGIVHMNERDSNAASRVFLKFLFQEIVVDLGIDNLKNRFEAAELQPFLKNLFPKEDHDDVMFSINYFTAIGLGALTEGMRNVLAKVEEQQRTRHLAAIKNSEMEEKDNPRVPRMHPDRLRRNRSRSPISRRNRSRTPPRRR